MGAIEPDDSILKTGTLKNYTNKSLVTPLNDKPTYIFEKDEIFKNLDETDNYDFLYKYFNAKDINPGYYKDNKESIQKIYSLKKQIDLGNWDIESMDTKQSNRKVS